MSNVLNRGGVPARTLSGTIVPILIVPEAPASGDCTAAIQAAMDALPATGGAILFEARSYLTNTVVARDGVTFICQGGGGDGNVVTGFTPYDDSKPALQLGDGVTQRRRFNMFGGRIYSQTNQFGLLINGMADVGIFGTEIGGYTKYAMRITSTATANSYYIDFIGCKWFAVAGMSTTGSRIIDLIYGAGFTTTIRLIGGSIDGSALGGASDFTGPCAIAIGQGVELWTQGFVLQLRHAKGVRFGGLAARLRADGGIADTSDAPSTAVLFEYPSNENSINTFVIGTLRINGQARNNVPTVIECRGLTGGGSGFFYNPSIYEPQFYGWIDLIPTTGTDKVRIQPGFGGSPEGSIAGNAGDVSISVNNVGSSNQVFAKTQDSVAGDATKGWQRLASGDYYQQTAPTALTAAATMDLLHDPGTWNSTTGSATVTSLGSDAAIDSGRVRRMVIGGSGQTVTFTHTAAPTGGQMFCIGQENVGALSGDVIDWIWLGAGSGWRMLGFWRFDGRPFLPGRRTWSPQVAHNLAIKPPQANAAGLNVLSGASSPAETFNTWDFDQTATEYIDIQGVFDYHFTNQGIVMTLLAICSLVSGVVQMRASCHRLNAYDLDTSVFAYATNSISSGAQNVAGTAGVPVLLTFVFPNASAALDGCGPGDSFNMRLWRDTSVGSNVAADVRVLENSIRISAP